jgi:hypothetical protein
MRNLSNPKRAALALFAFGAISLSGCAGFRAEHNGKQAGDAVCDLRNADNAEEAEDALDDADDALEDGQQIVGAPVSEDVKDIGENLGDLQEHVDGDNTALARQDINAIRRNVQAIITTTTGRTQRFYQGFDQGLAECSDD